jgi:hypothetical protein
VLVATAFATVAAQEVPRDDKGAIGILRRDGVLFPFASFERDEWEITWPLTFTGIKLPATLADIPEKWWGKGAPDRWRAHLTDGRSMPISLRAVGAFRPFCLDRPGLATTHKSAEALPPRPVQPFPKDGIAVSGNTPIDPIETVAPSSAEGRALAERLLKDFNQIEERTVGQLRVNTAWRHPIDVNIRQAAPIKLESWYRSPSSEPGWTVSYIEASRAYPPGPKDKGCGLETFVSGWIHQNRGEVERTSELRGKVTYCDRVGVVYMLPFGRIRPRTRDYWVFQLSGWEAEWYDVAEVAREKVRYVIEVNAGGCRF